MIEILIEYGIKLFLNWFIPGVRIKLFSDKSVEFSTNNLPHIIISFLDGIAYT